MKAIQKLDRREFTVQSVLALLSGVTITIWGCGDGDEASNSTGPTGPTGTSPSPSPDPSPAPEPTSDVMGTVGSNHGHVAIVTAAQLQSDDAVAVDIQGQADHPHTVMLTATELDQIAAGTRVSKTSSVNVAHAHSVTFN